MSRARDLLTAVTDIQHQAEDTRDLVLSWDLGPEHNRSVVRVKLAMDIAEQAALMAAGFVREEIERFPADDGRRYGHFVYTFTGRRFWPLDPRAEEVDVEDIAHALTFKCRWGGFSKRFYSVAEHSLNVARIARQLASKDGFPDPELAGAYGILHDAEEAYLPDVPRPVKAMLRGWPKIAARVQEAVHAAFHLPPPPAEVSEYVAAADDIALILESRLLFDGRLNWDVDPHRPRREVPPWVDLLPVIGEDFDKARTALRARLTQLMGRVEIADAIQDEIETKSHPRSEWKQEVKTAGGGASKCRVCEAPDADPVLQLCGDCAS